MMMKMMFVCCLNWRWWMPRSLLVIHTRWRPLSWSGMVWYGMVWYGVVPYWQPLSWGGMVWYGGIILIGAPSFSKNPHGARTFMEDLMWRDKNRQRLNQTDIECRWYSRSNLWIWRTKPHKHTTRWSLKRLLYWRCEKTEARFVKCDSPLQRYWAWLQWRWDEDNDDDEEDVRMMGIISKTHPTTIPWSDLLSQLGQLCVHEGDVVLTWTKKSWKILWTTNESKCSDRPTPSSQPSTCNASLCLGSCNPGREKKFIQKSIN